MAGGHNQKKAINVFLSCMAGIYFFAFASIYKQIPGLYGEKGLYPAAYILEDKSICADYDESCEKWSQAGHCSINSWMLTNCAKSCNACLVGFWKFAKFPTILWLTPSLGLTTETGMEFTCLVAISLSLSLLLSPMTRDCVCFAVLWFLYYSLVQVGQIFMYYQWDSLLLEAGFLSILIAPWNFFPGFWNLCRMRRFQSIGRFHDGIMFWLVKWLLFRLMFASGVVKLLWQDETWWNLSALQWHYESQCIPSPFAWYMAKLPIAFHRFSTVMTYFIEIGVPVFFFAPLRALRIFAFYCQILLQALIIFTGNYNFFNLLTIVLCLSLLDDRALQCNYKCCKKRQAAKPESKVSNVPCEGTAKIKTDSITASKSNGFKDQAGKRPVNKKYKFDRSSGEVLRDCLADLAEHRIQSKRLSTLKSVASDRKARLAVKVMKWALVVASVALLLGFTAKWSGMIFTKEDFIQVKLTFSYQDFLFAVENSVSWSIFFGTLSLSIEIFSAVIRSIVGCQKMSVKVFCVSRTVFFSVIAFWMFGISLVRYTDLDRVARDSLPRFLVKTYYDTEKYRLVDSYGLFRSMTGVGGRPEVIILGGNELTADANWTEYNFMYKPGHLYQAPPFNVPHQPRLDWQMWFAALEHYSGNLWYIHLCYKLLQGEKDVLHLLGHNDDLTHNPPRYIRSVLYRYHYTLNSSSLSTAISSKGNEKKWWIREYVDEYMPVVAKDDEGLQYLLKKYGLIRENRKMEKHYGPLHSFLLYVRKMALGFRAEVIIFLLLFKAIVVILLKDWWNSKGLYKSQPKLVNLENRFRSYINRHTKGLETTVNRIPSLHIKSKSKDRWTQ